ncbi:MAG TPA: fibronectin type III domain-containing protein [Candidatus Kapabacteria bacterium]|nr:fibronectin type III domain-containing protein [Candidatus Kapabacteria bacterium]
MSHLAPRTLALLLAATVAAGCSGAFDDAMSPYQTDKAPQQVWAARTTPRTIHLEWQPPFAVSGVTGYRVRCEWSAAHSARTFDLGPEARSIDLESIDSYPPCAFFVSALVGGSEGEARVVLLDEWQVSERVTPRTPAYIYSCGSALEGTEIRWLSAPDEAGLVDFEMRWRMMGDANWSSQVVNPNAGDPYELLGQTVRKAVVPIPGVVRPVFIELVARYEDGGRASRSTVLQESTWAAGRATPPLPPVNTTVTRVDPTSVRVTWTRTPSTGPIEYRIYAYDCLRYGEVVVAGVDAGTEGVVLRDLDLRKYFNYHVYAIRYGVESDPEIGQLQ